MNTGIIVDTCVWIEFFRRPASELSVHLKSLLLEHVKGLKRYRFP